MKDKYLSVQEKTTDSLKFNKVALPASKVTGGDKGMIPEYFGPTQPGQGADFYG